jgi:hypothetical protein
MAFFSRTYGLFWLFFDFFTIRERFERLMDLSWFVKPALHLFHIHHCHLLALHWTFAPMDRKALLCKDYSLLTIFVFAGNFS